MNARWLAAALALGCALHAAAGAAEDDKPDERARPLFLAGRAAYEAGRYREAADAFERVFAMTGHPFMLRNLGNAYAKLGETEHAKAALRQYLTLREDAADRQEAQAQLSALEKQDAPSAPSGVTAGGGATRGHDEEARGGLWLGRTFTWVALGTSAALGITATALWLDAHGQYDKLALGCGAHAGCTEPELRHVSATVTATNVTLGLSLASLATAVALFFVEGGDAHASQEHVTVSLAPQPQGLAVYAGGRL